MRVSLNGYFLGQSHTGSGQYVSHLVHGLPGMDIHVGRPRGAPGNVGKLRWEQMTWPKLARTVHADLLHGPYFALPLRRDRPTVVTIHDLIPMVLPAYRGSPLVRAYTWLQARACRSAEAIVVDSDSSRQDVLRLIAAPPDRVHTVYLGVEPRYKPDRSGASPLDRPYVFYIGGWDVRKNVPGLIRAFERLSVEHPELVRAIAGDRHSTSAMYPDLRAIAAPLGERVRFLGFVSERDKVALLQHAELFVYPSLYEGFGLDALNALACGCPVVCSDASSLPEVIGDAGLLVDASSDAAIARAMSRALEDSEPLREAGPRQAAKFTWEATARQTAAIYREILDR